MEWDNDLELERAKITDSEFTAGLRGNYRSNYRSCRRVARTYRFRQFFIDVILGMMTVG